MPESFGAARFPVDALHMVRQDYAGCALAGSNGHLERVRTPCIDVRNHCVLDWFSGKVNRSQHDFIGDPKVEVPAQYSDEFW